MILSHAFWEKHFHGDPASVGRQLVLDGAPQVIGVMPATDVDPMEALRYE